MKDEHGIEAGKSPAEYYRLRVEAIEKQVAENKKPIYWQVIVTLLDGVVFSASVGETTEKPHKPEWSTPLQNEYRVICKTKREAEYYRSVMRR